MSIPTKQGRFGRTLVPQPNWVWVLWRAACCSSLRGFLPGRYIYAERQHTGIRPINHCIRKRLAYVRQGHLIANRAGRAELKRRGFTL